jgi:hypothetical protein
VARAIAQVLVKARAQEHCALEPSRLLAEQASNNEESACRAILHPVLVKGRIITVDAIFSCRAWCAAVHVYQGYYLIPIKDNNPAVLRDLQEFFEDEGIDRQEFQFHKETTKGHGRLEVREIWGSHADERMVPERVGGDCTSLSDPQNRHPKGGRA